MGNETPMLPPPKLAQPLSAEELIEFVKITGPISDEMVINEALPGLKQHEITALVVDANNLFKRAKSNNFTIDYGRLRTVLASRCDLRYCTAFSAVDRESSHWLKYMTDNGFAVETKQVNQYISKTGEFITKGNMDVEITLAARDLAREFTHVIIATCDGDFKPLVERLKQDSYRTVSVLGMTNIFAKNHLEKWYGMSQDLAKAANHFYDLAKIKDHIQNTRMRS